MTISMINLFAGSDSDDNDDVSEFAGELEALLAELEHEKIHLESEINLVKALQQQEEEIKNSKLAYNLLLEQFEEGIKARVEEIDRRVSVEATVDAQGGMIAELLKKINELECGPAVARGDTDR